MRSTTREKLKAYAPESVLRLSHWRRDLWSELRLRLLADVGYLLSHRVRKRRLSASRPDFAVHVERPRRAEFYAPERIVAGEHCTIGDSCFLDGRTGLEIGDDVNLGSHLTIYTRQHDVDSPEFAEVGAPVRIGRYAWVASHAIVLPGVTIGRARWSRRTGGHQGRRAVCPRRR